MARLLSVINRLEKDVKLSIWLLAQSPRRASLRQTRGMASAPPTESAGTLVQAPSEGQVLSITKFNDDTLGASAAPISVVTHLRDVIEDLHVEGSEDIIKFLTRPTILTSGSVSTTDTGIMYSVDPFVALMQSAVKKDKLSGVFMFRADVILTLNINAVRFQTGRYILGWIPSGGASVGSTGYVRKYRMHTANLQTISQVPHVEIDLGTQTHVELRIPYTSIYPFVLNSPSLNPIMNIGKAFLIPYVPLQAASGDTTASYTLWGAFDNVTLSGPSYQSSFGEAEVKGTRAGPLTSGLRKVARASSILGEIPILGSGAMSVAWAAGILARAADVFGWSKPVNLGTPNYVVPRLIPYTSASDQQGTSQVMGVSSTNRLVSFPGSGTSAQDEMSVDFLKQVYALYRIVQWSSSNGVGTTLTTFAIDPSQFKLTYGKGSTFPPVSMLAAVAGMWRGSFKFRFKLVKNEFYSGRLLVDFFPSYNAGTLSGNMGLTEYLHRVIVDLRTTSEFEVCVPYISPTMYMNYGESVGVLEVYVLDALVVPSTCPSTVNIIIEVAGGGDFEVERPTMEDTSGTWEPYIPAVAQSADFEAFPCYPLGGSEKNAKAIVPSTICIGERLESLRQLAKLVMPKVPVSAITWVANNYALVKPYSLSYVGQYTDNSTVLLRSSFYCDYIDLISAMYSMTTGNMRVLAIPGVFTEAYVGAGITAPPASNSFLSQAAPATSSPSLIRTFVNSQYERVLDFIVPAYQKTIGRSVANQFATDNVTNSQPTGINSVTTGLFWYTYGSSDASPRPYTIVRQAADDWNCYGFISTVPMVLRTTA